MPRIDTFQPQNRLQVTSPVPIRGSSGARLQGEAISDFGASLAKAGNTLATFYKDADNADRKAKLDLIDAAKDSAAQKAFLDSQTKFQKIDGSDQLDIYTKSYQEQMQPLLDGIEDNELKGAASVIAQRGMNAQLDNVVRASITTKTKSIDNARQEAFGIRVGNAAVDPYNASQIIAANNATLDEMGKSGLYAADVLSNRKREESKNIAYSAIEGLISNENLGNGRFNDARNLITKDLAGSLGEEGPKLLARVAKEQEQWQDRTLRISHESEQRAKEAASEVRADNFTKFYTSMASAPMSEQDQILKDAQVALSEGKIKVEDFRRLENRSKNFSMVSNGPAEVAYVKQITEGKDLAGINDKIVKDIDSGLLSQQDGIRLMKMANTARNTRKSGDPILQKKRKLGLDMIQKANGGTENQLGEIIVPGSMAALNSQMVGAYYDLLDKGNLPDVAARKVMKDNYGEIAGTKFLPPVILPTHLQGDYKTMKESEPIVRERVQKLFSEGKVKEATEHMKLYQQRLNALKGQEDLRKGAQ